MKERTLNIIVLSTVFALMLAAFYVGCRALNNDRMLWLFAAAGVQSPRGAETFASPSVSVTVAWDASPGGADGYRVYLRKSGQTYTGYTDTGTNRIFRISGLARKTTYKVVVTAYKGTLESLRSEELTFRTPLKPDQDGEEL